MWVRSLLPTPTSLAMEVLSSFLSLSTLIETAIQINQMREIERERDNQKMNEYE
jgi:hypothetical protein